MLSFGLTNTAAKKKKKRTVISTLAIFGISIIPFTLLMIYRRGIPHNPKIKISHQNICPPNFVADQNSSVPFPLVFDNFCDNMNSFCLRHIEFQGKNLLINPSKLTFEESKRCVDGAVAYGLFIPAYQCVNSTCYYDKLPTCYDDSDCEIANHRGSCGYEFDDKDPGEKTCCKSGAMTLTENGPICTRQNPGSPCTTNAVCEGSCDPETGTCVHDDRVPQYIVKTWKMVDSSFLTMNDRELREEMSHPDPIWWESVSMAFSVRLMSGAAAWPSRSSGALSNPSLRRAVGPSRPTGCPISLIASGAVRISPDSAPSNSSCPLPATPPMPRISPCCTVR